MATVRRRSPAAFDLDDEDVPPPSSPAGIRRPVAGTLLLLAALLSAVAMVVPGGTAGTYWHDALSYAFGLAAFLTPVLLAGLGIGLIRARLDAGYALRWIEVSGWLAVFGGGDALLQLVTGNAAPRWRGDPGGGLLGAALWSLADGALGGIGAAIILVGLTLVGLGLALAVHPADIWYAVSAGTITLAGWTKRAIISLPPRIGRAFGKVARPTAPAAPVIRRPPPRDQAGDIPRAPVPAPAAARPAPAASSVAPPTGWPAAPAEARPFEGWEVPPVTMLQSGTAGELSQNELSKKVKLIEQTLAEFDVYAKVVQVNPGPTVTQFGLEPGYRERRDKSGNVVRRERIKVNEITTLQNDLALALAAPSIRIEAPVPGRQVVGIEVPNGQTTVVSLRQILESTAYQKLKARTKLAIALGEDVSGQPVVADLARMPHLLIAGATGSGKSVCVNAIISSLLLQATPDELRLLLVDPKRVELTNYNGIPHLLRPVVVDADKVVSVLKWTVHEMEERYKRFEQVGVRNIEGYNKLVLQKQSLLAGDAEPLNFIVLIIDELADLMMLAPDETERLICRLAQLARATGIHLVVATQRPSVDVITGLIKANFPTRISFAVTSQVDSRTILDTTGAEKLLGRGDMLFMPTDAAKPVRLQGVWVSEEEIEGIVNYWHQQGPARYVEQLVQAASFDPDDVDGDDLYDKAKEVALEHTRISASLLQRRLRIGYSRAARLMDLLEENGVVGGGEGGGKSREVLHADASGVPSEVTSGQVTIRGE